MRFDKIRYDGSEVELDWTEKLPGNTTLTQTLKSKEPPAPALRKALAAFVPYVVDLIEAPEHWRTNLEIRQISLNEEVKTGCRGLMVSALHPVERAKNRTLLLNTPYLSKAPDNYQGSGAGYLDDETLALIDEAEEAAEAYKDGERGEQMNLLPNEPVAEAKPRDPELPLPAAGDSKAGKKRPTVRRRKPKDFVPGVGDIANPEKTERPDDETLRDLLHRAGRDVPPDALARWTSTERDSAQRWADVELTSSEAAREANEEPLCLQLDATKQLADGWTAPTPPHLDADALQEIKASVEAGD